MSAAFRHLGPSTDRRTNRWSITLPCGHGKIEPRTTMLALDLIRCPKCEAEFIVNYNKQTIEKVED